MLMIYTDISGNYLKCTVKSPYLHILYFFYNIFALYFLNFWIKFSLFVVLSHVADYTKIAHSIVKDGFNDFKDIKEGEGIKKAYGLTQFLL